MPVPHQHTTVLSLLPPISVSASSQGLSSAASSQHRHQQHRQQSSVMLCRTPPNRRSYSGRPLISRYNKSCDWLGAAQLLEDDDNGGGVSVAYNPIAQVSSDILRASGYTQQFKSLLSSGNNRCSAGGRIPKQQSLEERCNGEVQSDGAVAVTAPPHLAAKSLEWNLVGVADEGAGLNGAAANRKHSSAAAQQQSAAMCRQIRRRQSGYGISITTESQAKMRCKLRKLYFVKRNKICDLSLLLAIIGLAFVVVDQELTANKLIEKSSTLSLLLRSFCVISTMMLIASLINYHRIEVKIALIDSGAEDWRVALTTDRVIKLFIEIAICAICPFPGSGCISWPYISPEEREIVPRPIPLDVLLAVPMFLRAYLLCRFMVLHSRQFQDAATRSIAALNRISMDFRFVIKTMMADHPMTVLVIFTASYWVCMSWMFTQCERYNGRYPSTEHYYMNSLWFIMVTFMSIGYGDVVPTSYCGRFLSITTGIVGAGVSSALIAVISRKLELSRAEKHVNNFMADSKLTNARKNAAASVLQHTWFIHKYQRGNGYKGDELRLRQHQRKFLNAINEFRRIKWDQRKLQEKGNSLLDVGKLHTEMHETLWEMHRTQETFAGMIEVLTKRIVELQATVLAATQQHQGRRGGGGGGGVLAREQQLKVPHQQERRGSHGESPSGGAVGGMDSTAGEKNAFAQVRRPQQRKYSHLGQHQLSTPQTILRISDQLNHSPAKPVIIDGFGPPASSNLALTNSCSSPCLQKPTTVMRVVYDSGSGDEAEMAPLIGAEGTMA